jgi:hypothetical protein
MVLITVFGAVFVLMAFAVSFMVFHRISPEQVVPVDVLSQDSLLDRYRPMFRLLDEWDCELVASGLPRGTALRRFRAERRSLFRVYLRNLGADHARIVEAMRNLVAESQMDRPELVKLLYRCQIMFRLAMISVEFKLFLHALGVGTVDVRSLVSTVQNLQVQLQDMVFVQAVG